VINYAPEGTFQIRAYANEKGAETCYSKWITVVVKSEISRIKIIGDDEI